jgi:uncharacterized protein (DUF302 family)
MKAFIAGLLLLVCGVAGAQDLYIVRTSMSFPEAMAFLQQTIKAQGYAVSRVQRVDIGLTKSGFKTDKYRIVFFGTLKDIQEITQKYPELIPYLPLKIANFAENDETLMVATSFEHLRPFYTSPALRANFDRWEADIRAILEQVRNAD